MLQRFQLAAFEFTGAMIEDLSPYTTACTWMQTERGPASLVATALFGLDRAFYYRNRPAFVLAVYDIDASRVWYGRCLPDDVAITADGTATMTAYGFWDAFGDLLHTAIWSTTRIDAWREVEKSEWGSANAALYSFDFTNRIAVMLTKGTAYLNGTDSGAVTIETPVGGSRPWTGIQFNYEINLPVGWVARLQTFDRTYGSTTLWWELAGTGAVLTGTRQIVPAAALKDRLVFYVRNTSGATYTNAAESGVYYLGLTGLRAITATDGLVNTTLGTVVIVPGVRVCTPGSMANIVIGRILTVGTTTVQEQVTVTAVTSTTFTATFALTHATTDLVYGWRGVTAEEIVAAILTENRALNSNQLAATTGLITSPNLDLPDFEYLDEPGATILERLLHFGDASFRRWAVGVDNLKQVFFHVRGTNNRAWYVTSEQLTIAGDGAARFNSAYAVYTDAMGATVRSAVATDANAVNALGLTRRSSVGSSTSNAALATNERDTFIADRKDGRPQIGIIIRQLSGRQSALWPLLSVRPGDTITIRDLPPTLSTGVDKIRTFVVAEVSYDAFIPDQITVAPEQPLPSMDVLLAQRGIDPRDFNP